MQGHRAEADPRTARAPVSSGTRCCSAQNWGWLLMKPVNYLIMLLQMNSSVCGLGSHSRNTLPSFSHKQLFCQFWYRLQLVFNKLTHPCVCVCVCHIICTFPLLPPEGDIVTLNWSWSKKEKCRRSRSCRLYSSFIQWYLEVLVTTNSTGEYTLQFKISELWLSPVLYKSLTPFEPHVLVTNWRSTS